MSTFKFFVSSDKFSRIVQIFLKFEMQMLSIAEKWKNGKISLKIVEKLVRLLAGEVAKLAPILAPCHAKLKYWHAFGMLACQIE